MPSTPLQLFRSRGFAWFVQGGLWCLLYLAAINLGGKAPEYSVASASSAPPQSAAPVARLDPLFASVSPGNLIRPSDTNAPNPFFTRYFVPPPSPAPPTTRKIEVTYQGFYQTGDGPKSAVLKLGDSFVVARVGTSVATNVYVADASLQEVTLTNGSQKTVVPLNAKKEIEVPFK
jgi:hypothetical protein